MYVVFLCACVCLDMFVALGCVYHCVSVCAYVLIHLSVCMFVFLLLSESGCVGFVSVCLCPWVVFTFLCACVGICAPVFGCVRVCVYLQLCFSLVCMQGQKHPESDRNRWHINMPEAGWRLKVQRVNRSTDLMSLSTAPRSGSGRGYPS